MVWVVLSVLQVVLTLSLGALTGPAPTGEAIGNAGWTILHTTTMAYPDNPTSEQQASMSKFFHYFAIVYPCTICSTHFQSELVQDPPKTESRKKLTQWLCEVHNRVNKRLGKAEFPCADIYTRWDARTQGTHPMQ